IRFKHIFAADSKFSYIDEHVKYPEIINLDDMSLDVSDFVIDGSDISVQINAIRGKEKRGIDITNLSTQFALTDNAMNFDDFHLETSDSDIEGTIHFSF